MKKKWKLVAVRSSHSLPNDSISRSLIHSLTNKLYILKSIMPSKLLGNLYDIEGWNIAHNFHAKNE
jgi:hypothetical protein